MSQKYQADIIVRTGDFAHIAVKPEGTLDELLSISDELTNMVNDKSELSASEWKKARMKMLLTAEFDPNDWDKLSKAQKYFINQAKLAFRDIKEEE